MTIRSGPCAECVVGSGLERAGLAGALMVALVVCVFAAAPSRAQETPATVDDVSITSDPQTYAVGDDIEVTLTFSEVVHVDQTSEELVLYLTIGEHSRGATFIEGSGTTDLKFRYTVQYGDEDTDGIAIGPGVTCTPPEDEEDEEECVQVSLQGATIVDAVGELAERKFDGIPAQAMHRVDGVSPMIAATDGVKITSSPEGTKYGLGEDILVEVTFDEVVHVDESISELALVLSIGTNSRRAAFADGSGTRMLTFRYVVQSDDKDDDGISIGPSALRGGVIEDAAGNPANRTFAGVAADGKHRVDGTKVDDDTDPGTRAFRIVSTPIADGTYGLNEKIRVAVDFGEHVHVTGSPSLSLSIGEHSRAAAYEGGSGTGTLTFGYVVRSDDRDTDGISIGANALTGGVIEDTKGNAVDRAFPALAARDRHKVDGATEPRPRAEIKSGGIYILGDEIMVVVDFGQEVRVGNASDLALFVTIGARSRGAAYVRGSGTRELSFVYRVRSNDEDGDGISIGRNALQGGVIEDAQGGAVDRALGALGDDENHKVDGIAPSVAAVRIVSAPIREGTYARNEKIRVEVEFDEDVDVRGSPTLTLSIGEDSEAAAYESGDGTDTLTFTHAVEAGDSDIDGISVPRNALRGNGIMDIAGNPADVALAGIETARGHKVNGGLAPRKQVRIVSTPLAGGTYGSGEEIRVEIDFGEVVDVASPTSLELFLTIGEHSREARLDDGSGTDTLTFRYTVQSTDRDSNGISIAASALQGSDIDNATGERVDKTLPSLPTQAGHKVNGKRTSQPAVRIVSAPQHGIYARDDAIKVEVDFGRTVQVSGSVSLMLSIGEHSREARLDDGSGTNRLTFAYTVQAGDQDDDGISIDSDALGEGGAIRDNESSEEVDRELAGLANAREHKVDGVSPSATAARIVSTPSAGGTYGLSQEIRVEVEFGEKVYVTEARGLSLTLSIGEHSREAAFVGGDGTDTLTFRYAVRSDDRDDDGVSIGPDALRGGVIRDFAGNEAERAFGGLAADAAHSVDGSSSAPRPVRIVSRPDSGGKYGLNEEIRVQIDFGEDVHVTGDPSMMLAIGEHLRAATLADGSGTPTLTFRYVVQDDDHDDDGISIGPNALRGGVIEDSAGNPVGRAFAGLEADSRHRVDGVRPSLTRVRFDSTAGADRTYGWGDEVRVVVEFDEVVHVKGELVLVLRIGEHERDATFVGGSGTDELMFRYVVAADDYDDDGISIGPGPDCLQGGAIIDAAGNPVDRTYRGLDADRRHKVDGDSLPEVSVRIASTPVADGVYGFGEAIRVGVDFGREVHVTEDGGALTLTLSIGENLRSATLAGGSGTDMLVFHYVVQSDDHDDDGISIGASALRGGRIEDGAGNVAERGFAALAADAGHKVDGVRSAVVRVSIISTPDANGVYGFGETIRMEADFGREVHVTEDGGALTLVLSIGENQRSATLAGGSGTDTLAFSYVVQSDDHDDDGISIGASALRGGRIEDGAGNVAERSIAALAADADHKVDGISPALVRVAIVSAPDAGDTYGVDELISVEVFFSEEVHVTEDAGLFFVIAIGEDLRRATLIDGSGTDTLTFGYAVQENDFDHDGISIGPNALQGGAIEDVAGNVVVRTFAGLSADADHKVDGVSAAIVRVTVVSTPADVDAYAADELISVEVYFGEEVHVTEDGGGPTLVLSIGENLRSATLAGGSGTDTLTFRYVVREDDRDDDGISIGPNALQGGAIQDSAGNPVDRAFAGLAADAFHKVDGRVDRVVPGILSVAITSDAGSNDSYTTDDVIEVEVEFNVAVYVTGAPPVLELSIGPALREATFAEGSGTPALRFEYTVEAGDTDTDGISIAANSLTGGITDVGGNAVDLAFDAVPASPSHKVSAELLLFPLSLTLVVGQSHTLDLLRELERLGVQYVGGFEWSSDDETVATAALSGTVLTITSVSEGAARIAVSATDAAIFLFFGVTVETSAAETAVLEGAMAAVGRGLMASAESTIGARLEMAESNPPDIWSGLGMAPSSAAVAAWPQWSAFDVAHHWGSPVGHGHLGVDDPYLRRSTGYAPAQLLRGRWFEMPFGGFGNRINSWAVWGAGDWHAFEGSPEDGIYDGSLASAYLGIDARGHGWVAGATISRSLAEASYEFAGAAAGKGRLETELDVIHPYVQWALGNRGKAWAILGLGTGEATAEREGDAAAEPGDLSMHMGLGGLRYSFGRVGWFDLAVRGDAGYAQLETEEGPRAIEGLSVNVQRVRLGAEVSLPMALAGIPVSPFLDVAGRFDGGDGETGGGVELAGGFRYRGPSVGLEVKGRTLVTHSAESYSEEGLKATLVVGPDGRTGFRLMLTPRWGGAAEAMDIFRYRGHPFAGALRRENRGWGLGTRISYGFDMRRGPGTIMPYWELDLSRDAYRQARLGVSYELASAFAGMPHRLELSGESTESDRHGSIMRFLLSGQAHF
ncbi:MAG: hypothetical protein OXH52_01850 [Gammaproteobacteria bacterium]|nr:hypothetical protein [Gammaproteobacteria bacterium]